MLVNAKPLIGTSVAVIEEGASVDALQAFKSKVRVRLEGWQPSNGGFLEFAFAYFPSDLLDEDVKTQKASEQIVRAFEKRETADLSLPEGNWSICAYGKDKDGLHARAVVVLDAQESNEQPHQWFNFEAPQSTEASNCDAGISETECFANELMETSFAEATSGEDVNKSLFLGTEIIKIVGKKPEDAKSGQKKNDEAGPKNEKQSEESLRIAKEVVATIMNTMELESPTEPQTSEPDTNPSQSRGNQKKGRSVSSFAAVEQLAQVTDVVSKPEFRKSEKLSKDVEVLLDFTIDQAEVNNEEVEQEEAEVFTQQMLSLIIAVSKVETSTAETPTESHTTGEPVQDPEEATEEPTPVSQEERCLRVRAGGARALKLLNAMREPLLSSDTMEKEFRAEDWQIGILREVGEEIENEPNARGSLQIEVPRSVVKQSAHDGDDHIDFATVVFDQETSQCFDDSSTKTSVQLASKVASICVLGYSGECEGVEYIDGDEGIEFTLQSSFTDMDDASQRLVCSWFDESHNAWKATGCETLGQSGDMVRCKCDHLTDFALVMHIVNDVSSSSEGVAGKTVSDRVFLVFSNVYFVIAGMSIFLFYIASTKIMNTKARRRVLIVVTLTIVAAALRGIITLLYYFQWVYLLIEQHGSSSSALLLMISFVAIVPLILEFGIFAFLAAMLTGAIRKIRSISVATVSRITSQKRLLYTAGATILMAIAPILFLSGVWLTSVGFVVAGHQMACVASVFVAINCVVIAVIFSLVSNRLENELSKRSKSSKRKNHLTHIYIRISRFINRFAVVLGITLAAESVVWTMSVTMRTFYIENIDSFQVAFYTIDCLALLITLVFESHIIERARRKRRSSQRFKRRLALMKLTSRTFGMSTAGGTGDSSPSSQTKSTSSSGHAGNAPTKTTPGLGLGQWKQGTPDGDSQNTSSYVEWTMNDTGAIDDMRSLTTTGESHYQRNISDWSVASEFQEGAGVLAMGHDEASTYSYNDTDELPSSLASPNNIDLSDASETDTESRQPAPAGGMISAVLQSGLFKMFGSKDSETATSEENEDEADSAERKRERKAYNVVLSESILPCK